MLTLNELSKQIKGGPFTFSIPAGIKYGIERYRRENGLRSGGEAARELLALGLANSGLEK